MEKNSIKTISTFFIVIILIICFLWYRNENSRLKQIEELKTRIEELEEENYALRKMSQWNP